MGKSTINGPFSIAMFVYQRVTGHSTDSTGQWLITLDLQYTVAQGDSPRFTRHPFLPVDHGECCKRAIIQRFAWNF